MSAERQPRLLAGDPWSEIRDGDPTGRALYDRHYSSRRYADGRRPAKFVGPGEYIALMTPDARALFVWRKFIDGCIPAQHGINCAIFRNEAPETYRSSELILAAEVWARRRWPGERMYTYVNAGRVRRKRDPGRCFRRAGWRPCGTTRGGLLIMEKLC